MQYDLLWLVIPLAVIGFFFILVVAACLWEKRPIQSYYVPPPGEEYAPSAVAIEANTQALALGFRHAARCHDAKGKLYRVRYDFWVSPDNTIFAVVGSGSIAKILVNGISLYSRSSDGRILSTTNEIGEQDISGVENQVTWPKLQFNPLLQKHGQRLTEVAVKPFAGDSALAAYFDIRRSKADALVARNYAYYLDDNRTVWRYNLKGAVVFYFVCTWVRPLRRFCRRIGLVRA